MSKLELTVSEIESELSFGKIDRESFLAECALSRIKLKSDKYNQQLDKFLSNLETSEMYSTDLSRTSDSLSKLSKLLTTSCDNLIRMMSKYEKNIFNKKD